MMRWTTLMAAGPSQHNLADPCCMHSALRYSTEWLQNNSAPQHLLGTKAQTRGEMSKKQRIWLHAERESMTLVARWTAAMAAGPSQHQVADPGCMHSALR